MDHIADLAFYFALAPCEADQRLRSPLLVPLQLSKIETRRQT